jgi:hypothetical protein
VRNIRIRRDIVSIVSIGALLALIFAPASHASEEEEMAKKSQNPLANIISVPFENNLYFDVGPSEEVANVLNIKPVIPFSLTKKINLINRFIVPVVYLEGQDSISVSDPEGGLGSVGIFPGTNDEFGLGNITYQTFFSPAEPGPLIWGVGTALILPTNSDPALGTDTWSAGPTALILSIKGPWVVGFLGQHVWSFAEHGSEPDVNSTLLRQSSTTTSAKVGISPPFPSSLRTGRSTTNGRFRSVAELGA